VWNLLKPLFSFCCLSAWHSVKPFNAPSCPCAFNYISMVFVASVLFDDELFYFVNEGIVHIRLVCPYALPLLRFVFFLLLSILGLYFVALFALLLV